MIDPILSAAIWQRYEQEQPKAGREFSAWVQRIAEESATSTSTVRRVVGEGAGAMLNAINDRFQTYAQQIAEFMGAGLVVALETLREGLTATKKRVALDKRGRPLLANEAADGPGFVPENFIWIEQPDWPSRLSAARSLLEVAGAKAPQQVEVKQNSLSVSVNLTPNDAMAELARLGEAIPRLQAAVAACGEGNPGAPRPRAAIEGAYGRPRPPLLDDGMHGDAR